MGYGVYVANDPMQSTEYGEYLTALDIPAEAPFYQALVTHMLDQWKTAEHLTAINKGIQSYNQALDYWRAESLDAVVNRKTRSTRALGKIEASNEPRTFGLVQQSLVRDST